MQKKQCPRSSLAAHRSFVKKTFLTGLLAVCLAVLSAAHGTELQKDILRKSVKNNLFCNITFKLPKPETFDVGKELVFEYRLTTSGIKPGVIAQLLIGKKKTYVRFESDGTWQKARVPFERVRYESAWKGVRPDAGELITGLNFYGRPANKADQTLELRNVAIRPVQLSFTVPAPKPGLNTFRPVSGSTELVTPPAFTWPEQADAASYELEYAQDKEFKTNLQHHTGLKHNAFCGEKTVSAGQWYWRVRFVGKTGKTSEWSSVIPFTVAKDAVRMVMLSRAELLKRIPAGHPRLFLRPEQVPAFKKRFSGDLKAEYERMLKRCDNILKQKTSVEEPGFHGKVGTPKGAAEWRKAYGHATRVSRNMSELAFAWMMTGKKEYLAESKRLLAGINAWDPAGASGMAHNDECGMPILRHMARTYTFLHGDLTPEERAAAIKTMQVRGRVAYNRLFPRLFTRPFDSHGNRMFYFLAEAGMAFYGEIPEAGEWFYAPMLYFYSCYPAWGDEDGGWHEGSAYFSGYMTTFSVWAETMKNVLDLPPMEKPFFAHAGQYLLYHEPPESAGYGWGDLTNYFQPYREAASLMRIWAAQSGNPYYEWYAARTERPDKNNDPSYLTMVRAAAPRIKGKAPADIPASRHFRKNGLVAMNTNLVSAKDSVQVLFKCGAQYGSTSHGYELPNTFIINAFGDRLLIRSGTRDSWGSNFHRNYMWELKSHNNILVNGKGMKKHIQEKQGEMLGVSLTPELDIAKGEAGMCYLEPGVKSYTREIRFRKPATILVIDRITAAKPVKLEWLLHARVPFNIRDQHHITLATDHAECRVDFLYPEKLAVSQTNQFDPPIDQPRLRQKFIEHHLTAVPDKLTTEACFITLIQPYKKGTPAPRPGVLKRTGTGFTVTVPEAHGNWTTAVE